MAETEVLSSLVPMGRLIFYRGCGKTAVFIEHLTIAHLAPVDERTVQSLPGYDPDSFGVWVYLKVRNPV